MKYTKYSKYVASLADEMSLEDLLAALSDYLLESGFQNESMYFQQMDEHSLDALRQAIQQALEMGEFLDEEMRERLEQMQADGTMEELIERLIERMQQEELISVDQPHDPSRQSTTPGQTGEAQTNARFEITDKSLDFLGFKTLRDLLGSLGRSSFGRHDTRDLATGIESSGASKPYEFGDTMNLDITETLSAAIQRVAQFADERSGAIRLRLEGNELKISSQSTESGESEDTIDTPYSSDPIVVGFNSGYILDFLKALGNEGEVRLEFKDSQSAGQMRPEDPDAEYRSRYVLMPMRI